jgi:hypothetical protein
VGRCDVARRLLLRGVVLVCLAAALFAIGCGDQQVESSASDLTAGHGAELVTVGGAWLNPEAASQVTFRVGAGELRILADVLGGAARNEPEPALSCVLRRLPESAGAPSEVVPLQTASHPELHHTLFVLHATLEPGVYRLTYRGDGRLKYLRIGAGY